VTNRRAAIAFVTVLALVGAIYGLHRASSNGATYSADEVVAAFADQQLAIRRIEPPKGSRDNLGGSAFLPADERFTLIVVDSDKTAEDWFKPYLRDTSPDTFEAREGNIIVIADGSNSDLPLPVSTGLKIRAALRELRERHS
jgi:hypothetical protein